MTETPLTESLVSSLKELFVPHVLMDHPLKGIDVSLYNFRRASVLIPLFYKEGELHVLLTKRSSDLTHHAGFVAFPGGMKDEEDKNDIETALRESDEEIGLKPSDVDVLGMLAPGFVRPNSIVTPVIGIISAHFVPVKNENEVALIFDLPLKRFLSNDRLEIRDWPGSNWIFHVHHFLDSVDGEEVDTWGFTASCCVIVALIAFQSDKQFCFADEMTVTIDNASHGIYNIVKPMLDKLFNNNKSLL